MKPRYLIPGLLLSFLLAFLPVANRAGSGELPVSDVGERQLYAAIGLSVKGLSMDVFLLALRGFQKLHAEGLLLKDSILTIADLSQSSRNKRLYVIDLARKVLLFNTYVAHGRNTGEEFARKFSNAAGSLKSSLGFYVTGQEIKGTEVGLSLVLEGMEKGFNDNARSREIIMHGAEYATERFIRKFGRLGRSFGCPSLPPELIRPVVDVIKEGSCLFIYNRDESYLKGSSVLN